MVILHYGSPVEGSCTMFSRKLKTLAILAFGALVMAGAAIAQNYHATVYSSTITVTNTFQLVFSGSNLNLVDCAIQNTGSHPEYVYPDIVANATVAGSVTLAPGQAMNCGGGAWALQNSFSITGTAGDTFYAARW